MFRVVSSSTSLVQRPECLLNGNTKSTNTQNRPQPLVAKLFHAGPECVLISSELLQLGELIGLGGRVTALLVLLLLGVAAEEAEEAVVCDGTEKLDGSEHVTAVQHDNERDVDESVAEIAVLC